MAGPPCVADAGGISPRFCRDLAPGALRRLRSVLPLADLVDAVVQFTHAAGQCADFFGRRHAELMHRALHAALEQCFEVVPGFLRLFARAADTRLQRLLRVFECVANSALRRRARLAEQLQAFDHGVLERLWSFLLRAASSAGTGRLAGA
jgi:hypothetical protein